MKIAMTTAALVFATVPMLAQAGEQGVAHPDQTPITLEGQSAPVERHATIPATPATAKPSAYVPYQYTPAPVAATPAPRVSSAAAPAKFNPDAEIVMTDAPAQTENEVYKPYRPYNGGNPGLAPRPAENDIDAGIVTEVPLRAGEMPEGTLVKVRMNEPLSTETTARGSAFSATVSEDVLREGRVVIPAGSVLDGMVTEVHGGRRISGRAAIHLEPRRVTLPDGTYYTVHAQVVDTSEAHSTRIDGEGTIVHRGHPAETLAVVGATTGSGAVAGALLGGGVGAAVGAGIGAGAGTILWLKQDRQTALPKNTGLVFSLTTPMLIQPLQDGARLR